MSPGIEATTKFYWTEFEGVFSVIWSMLFFQFIDETDRFGGL